MVPSARPQEYPEFDRASKAPYVSFPISQELAVCADFWQRRASIFHVTLHHGCEKLFTMTNVRKGSGKFTRDLKGCLLMFKSCCMSYFPAVTDCVCVCAVAVVGSVSLPCFIDDPASAVKLLCCRSVSTCYFLLR